MLLNNNKYKIQTALITETVDFLKRNVIFLKNHIKKFCIYLYIVIFAI